MKKKVFHLLFCLVMANTFIHAANRGHIYSGETKDSLEISSPSFEDTFDFDGIVNDRVIISVEPTSGTLSPLVKVYPPGGGPYEILSINTIDHQLLQTGIYTIVVSDNLYDDTGTYNITLTFI